MLLRLDLQCVFSATFFGRYIFDRYRMSVDIMCANAAQLDSSEQCVTLKSHLPSTFHECANRSDQT